MQQCWQAMRAVPSLPRATILISFPQDVKDCIPHSTIVLSYLAGVTIASVFGSVCVCVWARGICAISCAIGKFYPNHLAHTYKRTE